MGLELQGVGSRHRDVVDLDHLIAHSNPGRLGLGARRDLGDLDPRDGLAEEAVGHDLDAKTDLPGRGCGLTRASLAQKEYKTKVQAKAAEVADKAARLASKGGMSADAAAEIRKMILGIAG